MQASSSNKMREVSGQGGGGKGWAKLRVRLDDAKAQAPSMRTSGSVHLRQKQLVIEPLPEETAAAFADVVHRAKLSGARLTRSEKVTAKRAAKEERGASDAIS